MHKLYMLNKAVLEFSVIQQLLCFFVAFVEDNATMSSIRHFENHALYFVQNQRK